jgi:hypothetical protein
MSIALTRAPPRAAGRAQVAGAARHVEYPLAGRELQALNEFRGAALEAHRDPPEVARRPRGPHPRAQRLRRLRLRLLLL